MKKTAILLMLIAACPAFTWFSPLPEFQQGTVLVWRSENRGHSYNFVLRLARFLPSRYFEWENQSTQGTVLLKPGAVEKSRKYTSFRLFQGGVDIESSDEICYWLSKAVFEELKASKKASLFLDGLKTDLVLEAEGQIQVQVNQSPVDLPVIIIKDGRGGRWWILDHPDNPLVVKHQLNTFQEQLTSINTERKDSLRWIKGPRLNKS